MMCRGFVTRLHSQARASERVRWEVVRTLPGARVDMGEVER